MNAGIARHATAFPNPVHTRELVVSLRDFVRDALDLDPIPPRVAVPAQGPTRPATAGGRGKGDGGQSGAEQGGGGGKVGERADGSGESHRAGDHA